MVVALKRYFSLFKKANSGNVTIMFAAALIPIMLVAGGAIDYARESSLRTELQNTVDTAMLAGARALANNENVNAAVDNYIHGNWPESVALPDYTVEVNGDDVSITFSTPVVLKTQMLSMFGWADMPVKTHAVATITSESAPLDIALSVDSSDSMGQGGKLDMAKAELHAFYRKVYDHNQGLDGHDMDWISFVNFSRSQVTMTYSLTANIAGLDTLVDRMKRDGNTAMGLGIQESWGWLLRSERRYPSSNYKHDTRNSQYLVLLSDGDEDKIAGLTSANVCPKVKADGVKIIVIAFPPAHGTANTANLQACAGDPKNFYWANGSQLSRVFDDMAVSNKQVRLKE